MNFLVCALVALLALVHNGQALKCYECSGSEMSDCAKGIKGAGVEVKCDAPDYDTPYGYGGPVASTASASSSGEESTTEMDATTTESQSDKMRRLGCFQPMKLYPACVTYSMEPYNGIDKQKMVYRSCMLTADDFCKSQLQYNKESMCRSCNSTDFCM